MVGLRSCHPPFWINMIYLHILGACTLFMLGLCLTQLYLFLRVKTEKVKYDLKLQKEYTVSQEATASPLAQLWEEETL